MKILDKEIDYDLTDADNIDRIRELDINYAEKLQKTDKLSEQCKIYKDFFDTVIGEGTSNLLFGDKNNYMLIIRAYKDLIFNITEALEEFTKEAEETRKKYERYTK